MTRLGPAQKFYLTLVINIVILVALTYFIPYQLFLRIQQATAKLNDARTQIAEADAARETARLQEEIIKSHQAELNLLQNYFFSDEDPSRALQIVETAEGIAKMSGVDLGTDALGVDQDAARFRFSVTGTYPQIVRFMRLIQSAPVYFDVDQYWFDKVNEKSSQTGLNSLSQTIKTSVQAVLTAKVYRVPKVIKK